MPRKTLTQYKQGAPEIPTNTCPYVDFLQEIIKEIKDEKSSTFLEQKLYLADSLLEYIRQSNDSLRQSSHYWYSKFKSIYK
jgi:FtsZ-binding cell division protein ZapB